MLGPFLKKVPADRKLAIEIRNRTWLDTVLADLLREHKVALVLQDLSSMPRPWEFKAKFDFVAADFAYVRWLGDRKGIEEQTTTWDKTVVDRRSDLMNWVERSSSWVEGADDGAAQGGNLLFLLLDSQRFLRALQRGSSPVAFSREHVYVVTSRATSKSLWSRSSNSYC